MKLDVIIDVVCPWCFLGKRQLDKAMEMRPGLITSVQWHPFQLSPNTPPSGVDRETYYTQKFGNGPELPAMRERLLGLGGELGIDFDFESDCQIANSMDAHRLILWARKNDCQSEVAEAVMKAYFEDCLFIGDHGLLTDIAKKAGMDSDLVAELLASERDCDYIHNEMMQAREVGITGVPFFIFDENVTVSGAQPAEVLVQVMDRAAAKQTESVG